MILQHIQRGRRRRGVHRALVLGASLGVLGGCESLLEADLPHVLTDDAIAAARTAELQVNSAIALFECGYTAFGLMGLGHEDVMESIAGSAQQHQYNLTPVTGNCDLTSQSTASFDQIMGTRAMISTDPAKLVAGSEGKATGVYDRINGEWKGQLGRQGERFSAIAAIYMGASLAHMGEFFCELAFDGSDLVKPTEVLKLGDTWITDRALQHIQTHGDFAMPNGIAPSARLMALSIRSRIRWANRDYTGAAADASTVLAANPTFNAWITRETGMTRRNKIFHSATAVGFSSGLGVNDWWNPSLRSPNPVTGQQWPSPIPHTGYLFVGIMPDGRALESGNLPVLWAQESRNAQGNPISLNNGAVPDTRVQHIRKSIQGPGLHEVPARYSSEDDDVPYMTWQELRLILADEALAQGNLQGAIDQVNTIRTAHRLPTISGAYRATLLGSKNAVRHMLLEERRREFYAEGGRYWSTKIQNTDVLWFPRGEGVTPSNSYVLQGGVRLPMPDDEYQGNPKFLARGGLAARGTGCRDLPGAQAPVIR